MKKFRIFALLLVMIGCRNERSEVQQERATNESINQANSQIGMPGITKFTERRLLKQIYELRDSENLVCYAYVETLDGHLRFLTKCIGYGIPYSTQYSNPTQSITGQPQAEPNALYMPSSADATWLMIPDSKGVGRPVYFEPRVVVSPIKITAALDNPVE